MLVVWLLAASMGPMIESCSQTVRETGIERIVRYRRSCLRTNLARSEPEAEILLLKRMPNWKRVQLLKYDLLWT
jgi:hypothetical protein